MKNNLTPDEIQIRDHLWGLSLDKALLLIDKLTKNGTDLGAQRTLARCSLFFLISVVLKWDVDPWRYQRILEVDKEPDNCIDLWFRGAGKTGTITIAKTIQDLLTFDNLAILIFGNTFSIAEKNLREISQILSSSDLLKSLFPDLLYADPVNQSPLWNRTMINIKRTIVRKEPSIQCSGFDRAAPVGLHSDILVYDDIVTNKSVNTPEMIQKTTQSFYETLSCAAIDHRIRIIGTRWHYDDTYSELLKSQTYKPRVYPALDAQGEPILFTRAQWEKILRRGKYVVACQYMLDPLGGMSHVFEVEKLMWYDVRPLMMHLYILGDPAKSMAADADDTAIIVIGVIREGQMFVLDGVCHRMTLVDRWNHLKRLYLKWYKAPGVQGVKVGWENWGNTDAEYFRNQMGKGFDQVQFTVQDIVRIKGVGGQGVNAKFARIERIQPDLEQKRIYLPYDVYSNAINPGHPTKGQMEATKNKMELLISKPIKNKDQDGNVYNLVNILLDQLKHYPYSSKLDLIDAFSRIYDMEVRNPPTLADKYGSTIIGKRKKYDYHLTPIQPRKSYFPTRETR